jgi:hypothetical protein
LNEKQVARNEKQFLAFSVEFLGLHIPGHYVWFSIPIVILTLSFLPTGISAGNGRVKHLEYPVEG